MSEENIKQTTRSKFNFCQRPGQSHFCYSYFCKFFFGGGSISVGIDNENRKDIAGGEKIFIKDRGENII